jgi:acetyltransferase-like isoleucine patch superfamily enzyme
MLNLEQYKSVWILGCGEALESIADDKLGYGLEDKAVNFYRFDNVSQISVLADDALRQRSPEHDILFAAVDSNALNFARLELYGRARLGGFKFISLIHQSAILSPSVKVGENVWIGPLSSIGASCNIDNNAFIGAQCRLDACVSLRSNTWLGAGAIIGANCQIEPHTVIGNNVTLLHNLKLGRYVLVDHHGMLRNNLSPGTFIEDIYTNSAQLVGPGYSYNSHLTSLAKF